MRCLRVHYAVKKFVNHSGRWPRHETFISLRACLWGLKTHIYSLRGSSSAWETLSRADLEWSPGPSTWPMDCGRISPLVNWCWSVDRGTWSPWMMMLCRLQSHSRPSYLHTCRLRFVCKLISWGHKTAMYAAGRCHCNTMSCRVLMW